MIKELQQLGLTIYESRILEVLSKKKSDLRQLSKEANVPFGKIYSVVKNLRQKGLISETNTRPKLIFTENFSNNIDWLIKQKTQKEKNIFENLRQVAMNVDIQKGSSSKFLEIGTTTEENRRIQMRTFTEAEREVLQIINIHHKPKSNRESKTAWENEIVNAVNRGVGFKAIYPKEIILPKILLDLNKKFPDKFVVRRRDTDFVRCDIIDEKKVLIKLVNDDPLLFGGVLFIENERLAGNLRRYFLGLWNS